MRSLLVLTVLAIPTTTAAQVGHAPDQSPYRDITHNTTLTLFGGRFGGDGGQTGAGPHGGQLFGARIDLMTARAVTIGFVVARASAERLIVDPFVQVSRRESGPVSQDVTLGEIDLQLNLTGGKTWHGLAPFVGTGIGFAFGSSTPADTSGFEFGSKFFFAPHTGVRAYLTRQVFLRLEARAVFWNLSFPEAFRQEPPLEPATPGISNAVFPDGQLKQWVTNPTLSVGLGTTLRLPF